MNRATKRSPASVEAGPFMLNVFREGVLLGHFLVGLVALGLYSGSSRFGLEFLTRNGYRLSLSLCHFLVDLIAFFVFGLQLSMEARAGLSTLTIEARELRGKLYDAACSLARRLRAGTRTSTLSVFSCGMGCLLWVTYDSRRMQRRRGAEWRPLDTYQDAFGRSIPVRPYAYTSGIVLHTQPQAGYAVSLLPPGTFGVGTRSGPHP